VTSRVWRYRVTCRHRRDVDHWWRHQSTRGRHFPMGPPEWFSFREQQSCRQTDS